MKKNDFSKLLSWFFVGLFLLTVGSIALRVGGYTLDTKSIGWLAWFNSVPYLLSVLLFLALFLKTIVSDKTRWTRWSCVAIGALLLLCYNILFLVFITIHGFEEHLYFWLVNLFLILPFFLVPLIFRKGIWTRWLFAIEMFVLLISASSLLSINIEHFSEVKLQTRYLYRNIEKSNEYVAVFENPDNPNDAQEYFVVRNFGLLKKQPFKESLLSGVWSKYDEDGNVTAEFTYEEGTILKRNFSRHALQIYNNADFTEMANSTGNESQYVVLDDVLLNKEVVIKHKPKISIEGFGKDEPNASLYSTYGDPVRITFDGCEHVILKKLDFRLNSEFEQPFILSFKNCKRVEIVDCSFSGNAKFSLSFDDNCDEIHLEDNIIDGFQEYGVFMHNGEQKHYYANGNYYYYQDNRYITSRRIWIEGFDRVNFDDFKLDEAWVEHDAWYFDDNNYPTANFSGHTIGAFTVYYEYLPDALGLEDYFEDKYFSMVEGNDLPRFANMLALMTGINPVVSPAHQSSELEFKHINPEFVQWANDHITANIVSQKFYDFVLKQFSRLFCESYLHLQHNEETEAVIHRYYQEVYSGDVIVYLDEHFKGVLSNYTLSDGDEQKAYYGISRQTALMGFWIRRMIDESHASIWEAAGKFMTFYDKEWLDETIQRYRIDETDSDYFGDSVRVPEENENTNFE